MKEHRHSTTHIHIHIDVNRTEVERITTLELQENSESKATLMTLKYQQRINNLSNQLCITRNLKELQRIIMSSKQRIL